MGLKVSVDAWTLTVILFFSTSEVKPKSQLVITAIIQNNGIGLIGISISKHKVIVLYAN